jgi:OPT family small oligopeptide transporter
LVLCALFNTLHSQEYAGIGNRGGLSRERFFLYAFLGSFFWYFFPGYIFTALSVFSWACWIAPTNIKVNQLFGYSSGLGMGLITFDWSQIAYIGSPLATPWWAEANVAAGFLFFFWFVTPILYYTNTWFSEFMPMSSRTSYDNTGGPYDVTRILNNDSTINLEAYHSYSPLFLSTTFALSYGLSFASITATIMHAILYFRKQIWVQSRRSLSEQPDIHARLMSRYPQVPEWWYACIFLTMFIFGIVSIEVWPTQFPVWAFVLALIIAFVYIIPIGMIQAITNQQVGLNVITELIIGYALPGRPVAMMMFKTWGYITMAQALTFASDFKLGHYMKIPPRPMFWAQVWATVVAGTVQLGVQAWMFTNIDNMCDPKQKDGFICPSTEVFGTASIIWGVIGPALQFSKGQLYYGLTFFFLIGAIAPCIPWLITRKYPNSFFKYVNMPGTSCFAPVLPFTRAHLALQLSSPVLASSRPPRPSTTCPGQSSASSSSTSSAGVTSPGGPSTTTCSPPPSTRASPSRSSSFSSACSSPRTARSARRTSRRGGATRSTPGPPTGTPPRSGPSIPARRSAPRLGKSRCTISVVPWRLAQWIGGVVARSYLGGCLVLWLVARLCGTVSA